MDPKKYRVALTQRGADGFLTTTDTYYATRPTAMRKAKALSRGGASAEVMRKRDGGETYYYVCEYCDGELM